MNLTDLPPLIEPRNAVYRGFTLPPPAILRARPLGADGARLLDSAQYPYPLHHPFAVRQRADYLAMAMLADIHCSAWRDIKRTGDATRALAALLLGDAESARLILVDALAEYAAEQHRAEEDKRLGLDRKDYGADGKITYSADEWDHHVARETLAMARAA